MAFSSFVLTDFGLALDAKMRAGKKVTISRVALGDGSIGTGSVFSVTKLKSERLSLPVSSVSHSSVEAIVTAILSNEMLEEGFHLREMGVMAIDPDSKVEGVYLYNRDSGEGEYLPDKNSAQRLKEHLRIRFKSSHAENIVFEYNGAPIDVTREDLDAHDASETAHQNILGGKEPVLKGATTKVSPVDGDSLALVDSEDEGKTKRLLWSVIKATLKTWFDTLYAGVSHSHAWGAITGKPTSFVPVAHKDSHKTGGTDALAPGDIGAEVAGAAAAVQANLTTHAGDAVKHITAAERAAWNGKAAGSHTHAPTDLSSAVPITKGGTGATTAAAARAALAALAAFTPTAITISATWSGTGPWTQSIAVAGVLAAWDWRLGLHLAKITDDAARKLQEKAFACITWCETYDGGITLTCRDKKPDVAISAVLAGEV